MLKHAGKGEILLRTVQGAPDGPGIELLALDHGPGMLDVSRCFEDGYSTAGSPGTGLGAISRMASLLDIYSNPQHGTALLLRVFAQGSSDPSPDDLGVVRRVASYPMHSGSVLVMHTDGVNSRTSVDAYPGLLARHPALIAGVLYRDLLRGKDDATVVVVKGATRTL